jgi:hypothetical protein
VHAGQTIGIAISDTTLAIELDDAETRVMRRTTTKPVRNIKADRPWTVPSVFLGSTSTISWHENVKRHLAQDKLAHLARTACEA